MCVDLDGIYERRGAAVGEQGDTWVVGLRQNTKMEAIQKEATHNLTTHLQQGILAHIAAVCRYKYRCFL